MAKKQTTTILLLAAAAAGAYFFMKKKSGETVKLTEENKEEGTAEEMKPEAVVTAPPGNFAAALEKAQEVASTIKDTVVAVKSGNKVAVVKSGKKKRKKCPKVSKEQINKICQGLKGKSLRQCRRKNKRSCITVQNLETTKIGM